MRVFVCILHYMAVNVNYHHSIIQRLKLQVGYQFVNLLFRGNRRSHKVDLDLLNDVTEQHGGGGEPLNFAGRDKDA
jgi:hypothetical protein